MKKLLLLILILSSSTAISEELSKPEKVGELAFQTVNFIDMMQTLEIVQHSDKWYETNPILGKHPRQNEVITYFMIRGATHYHITKWLPKKFRPVWLTVTFLPQIPLIEHNHNLGIRIGW
tara:strand:- start:189 stop:548 length:360 start_codon:yes stop_codon:yes gene_type:complete